MNKVINGKGYNTETARKLADRWNGYGSNDFNYIREELYVKRTGEYFIYGQGGALTKYSESHGNMVSGGETIIPVTLKSAKEWAEEHLGGDEYEEIFGGVEEPAEASEQQQYSVLLPVPVIESLKAKKEATGMNVSALIIKALRDAGYGNEERK